MARTTPPNESPAPPRSDARLGAVSYVVLGFVSGNGELTSYELKQKVETSVGYIWPFPHTQLYTEPKRLVELGLLSETTEEGGRRRRSYSITPEGSAALSSWLDIPVRSETEIRDLGLLQLFFAATDGAEPSQIADRLRSLANEQIAAHEARMGEYSAIEAGMAAGAFGDIPEGGSCHKTLSVGMAMERLMIDFWSGIEANPPDH